MRVIGIDPGTVNVGWGVVEQHGTRMTHIAHGVLKLKGDFADRLVQLDVSLDKVIAAQTPEASAIESIFYSKNAQTACKLGHARGVAIVCLRRAGLAVGEYPPARVKRAISGHGRADKHQVTHIVTSVLRLSEAPLEDAADALASAITHLNTSRFDEALRRKRA